MERILVLDFGGQYAHLIANKIRRIGTYSDICLPDSALIEAKKPGVKGIIFSGGPSSVYEPGAPTIPDELLKLGIPVLGICYGHQLMAHKLGGKVSPGNIKEYGLAQISIDESRLFRGISGKEVVWMSHGDSVSELPPGFEMIASSSSCKISAMADEKRKLYGAQFHPEVTHTAKGMRILENFVEICGCRRNWNTKSYLEEIREKVRNQVGSKKVFLLVSGGVDSAVLFDLLNKTLGKERVLGLHVDTGLMRAGESETIKESFHALGFNNLKTVDASSKFLEALKESVLPEDKRRIIGDLFIDVVAEHSDKILSSDDWLVAQGTIYPDTIESRGTRNSDLIKTHHNRVRRMQELIEQGKVIEPLSQLYKDEVRELGRMLELPESIIARHPFPGPGLGVRILCNDKPRSRFGGLEEINMKAKEIAPDAFTLPIKSVGVQGDSRSYKHPAVLTTIRDWDSLEKLSTELTNKVHEINRVLLLVRRKEKEENKKRKEEESSVRIGDARGGMRLLERRITPERVALLKKADKIINDYLHDKGLYDSVWQMPVVLIPVSFFGGESIILRPVSSSEAMTANFAKLPIEVVEEMADALLGMSDGSSGIDAVFYDITNKPPATIEWE